MKIGILTFHRAINYGAFLQAFALKTYLSSLGHDVRFVDYWPKAHADIYRLFDARWKKRSLAVKAKLIISFLFRYGRAKTRKNKMTSLSIRYLGITEKVSYLTPESLIDIDFDCIIYGSDQIWWKSHIPGYEGFDPVYWGNFVNSSIKKIAYAPSMGVIDLNENDKLSIKQYLLNFEKISVRESSLKDAIRNLADKDLPVVLDPVFLLSKEDWEKMCIPISKGKYILYYNLLPSDDTDKFVTKIQQHLSYKIIEVTGAVHALKFQNKYIQTADALEFISLIHNAEFVITSSFHGVAFSIIFEKQFYAVGMGNRSGRVKSLLKMLGIEDRLLINSRTVNIQKSIDYQDVLSRLSIQKELSESFLQQV